MGRDVRGRLAGKSKARSVDVELTMSSVKSVSRMQLAVTFALAGVYMATVHRSLPGGDAGELIVAADQLGVAHPPGYPLYTLLLKLSFLLIPHGTIALKANLLTALLAAAAGGFLYQAAFLLTGHVAPGLLAAGMFAFSRLTWTWSVGAEVFALNNLLLAVLLLTAVRFSQGSPSHRAKLSLVGAFVCGLSLSNQHTAVVYVAVCAVWVLFTLLRDKALSMKLLTHISLCFLAGLLPYVYLPVSALTRQTRWTWGDQSSVSGFLTHLFRTEYGTLHLLKDHEGQGLMHGLAAYTYHVVEDLTLPVLLLFAMVLVSIQHRRRSPQNQIIPVFLFMLTVYAIFFAWRANLDINSPLYLGVVERFWMQSDLVLMLIAAVVFSDITSTADRFLSLRKWNADVIIAVAMVVLQLGKNMGSCDQSSNYVVRDFAMATLRAFPAGSVVMTKGDLPSTSLRYFHVSEGVRSDLVIVDQEMLTYNWSVPMMRSHLTGFIMPGDQLYTYSTVTSEGRKLFTFRQLLDANYDKKPLFGCIGIQDHEPSWQETYELRPFGVCMQFIKKGSNREKNMKEWLESCHQFAADWPHTLPKSDATWEDIASSEMWRAKTVAGFHLLETADQAETSKAKAAWLKEAYHIYKEAIESHAHVPAYWHKNYALVCEKLRQVSPETEATSLLKASIMHFRIYLDTGEADPQRDAIEKAVRTLQAYLQHLQKK